MKIITLKEEKLYLEIWKEQRGVQRYNIILKQKYKAHYTQYSTFETLHLLFFV